MSGDQINSGNSAFEQLAQALVEDGIDIIDADPQLAYIETPESMWLVVDGPSPEFMSSYRVETMAEKSRKIFKTYAPQINEAAEDLMRGGSTIYAKTSLQLKRHVQETKTSSQ